MVRRRHKRLAREIARESFIACKGDTEASLAYFRAHPRLFAIDPQLIVLMIQIAIMLWKLWQSRSVSEPSVVASSDELEILGESFFSEEPDDE